MTRGTELAGKVALVTGGARNIGRAICRSLAAGGASVMVNANTSKAMAEETVKMIGAPAAYFMADVTKPEEVASLVKETIRRFGRLDFLVNNAAVRAETPFEEIRLEDWRKVLSIILDGAFLCAQACIPHMKEAGTIINIGGLTGHRGATGRAHVIAAKSGLAGMTKALALDLAPKKITVNCVVPGLIGTPRPKDKPEPAHHLTHQTISGERGRPADVAATVRFLCGPGARFINGQAIHANGGAYLGA